MGECVLILLVVSCGFVFVSVVMFPITLGEYTKARDGVTPEIKNQTSNLAYLSLCDYSSHELFAVYLYFDYFNGENISKINNDEFPYIEFNHTGCFITFTNYSDNIRGLYKPPENEIQNDINYIFSECEKFFNTSYNKFQIKNLQQKYNKIILNNFNKRKSNLKSFTVIFIIAMIVVVCWIVALIVFCIKPDCVNY